MPVVTIEVRKKYTQEQEVALMTAVYEALQEAFNITNGDISIRFLAYEPHRFTVPLTGTTPPMYSQPELFTLISIDCYPGRTLDIKRNLYRLTVNSLEALGVPKDHIKILVREVPKENWGIRGGQPGSEVVLNYKLEI